MYPWTTSLIFCLKKYVTYHNHAFAEFSSFISLIQTHTTAHLLFFFTFIKTKAIHFGGVVCHKLPSTRRQVWHLHHRIIPWCRILKSPPLTKVWSTLSVFFSSSSTKKRKSYDFFFLTFHTDLFYCALHCLLQEKWSSGQRSDPPNVVELGI